MEYQNYWDFQLFYDENEWYSGKKINEMARLRYMKIKRPKGPTARDL